MTTCLTFPVPDSKILGSTPLARGAARFVEGLVLLVLIAAASQALGSSVPAAALPAATLAAETPTGVTLPGETPAAEVLPQGSLSGEALEQRLQAGPGLADLIARAYEANPVIRAARAAWQQSLAIRRVSAAYPDPEFLMTFWPRSMADDLEARTVETMVSQPIPFPGKLSARDGVARAESDIRRLDLDRTVRDVVIAVRESFHELVYIREAERIAKANLLLLLKIQAEGETAYASDRASLMDIMKARSQSAQSGYDATLLQELEKTERTRLNALLNRHWEAPLGPLRADRVHEPLLFSLDAIADMARANREENQLAGAAILKSEAEATLARFDTYPDFRLGLLYEYSLSEMGGVTSREDMYGVQFGMTLPVNPGKNSGRREAARAGVEQARAMADSAVNDTLAMVRENHFRLQNSERLIFLYRDTLIPQAAQALETAEVWNRQGQGSLADALESQSVWYNFQLALARALADYGKYLARLEGLAGQSLRKNRGTP